MNQGLPVFDLPKRESQSTAIIGALAVALTAKRRPMLDMRDLPNPPSIFQQHKPA